MGFDLAKHGLNLKVGFKTKFGLILGTKNVIEEEEEEEKKRRGGVQEGFKGMELLIFVWNYELLYEFPYNCMISSLPKPRI